VGADDNGASSCWAAASSGLGSGTVAGIGSTVSVGMVLSAGAVWGRCRSSERFLDWGGLRKRFRGGRCGFLNWHGLRSRFEGRRCRCFNLSRLQKWFVGGRRRARLGLRDILSWAGGRKISKGRANLVPARCSANFRTACADVDLRKK
jgi:hypothetical protein